MELFAFLRQVEVFTDFDDAAIGRLAAVSRLARFAPGDAIVRQGGAVENVGVIESGEVEVRFADASNLREPITLKPGHLFGEISLLTGEAAMADVIAVRPAQIVLVPHAALTAELGRAPLSTRRLARLLAERLARRTSDPYEQSEVARLRGDARVRAGTIEAAVRDPILVFSVAASAVSYALFVAGERRLWGGIERLGERPARVRQCTVAGEQSWELDLPDHEAALRLVLGELTRPGIGGLQSLGEICAVGHRVVHGGDRFHEAQLVTGEVERSLRELSELAPLHNPWNLAGIELAERLLPGVPQVAVFDTAFHLTLGEHAYRYALPRELAGHLRRYGFHGLSHRHAATGAALVMGRPLEELKLVTLHLGAGASAAAIDRGRSVDTSMGLTPLEGLIMGTRAGDLDPGLVLRLLKEGHGVDELELTLNTRSGLLGLSGLSADLGELLAATGAGHQGALLAVQSFCWRVRKYIGAYAAILGGLDALVFTGVVGERLDLVRSLITQNLGFLGIAIDESRNAGPVVRRGPPLDISAAEARVRTLVVPDDDEGAIAVEVASALRRAGAAEVVAARRDTRIPVGVSAHHVHLSQAHVEALFGTGHELTFRSSLSQPGQFACQETVDLIGPKGRIDRVRVLGPKRPETQIEIARTEEFKLGIDAPIRASGDLRGSPGLTLVGPAGEIRLEDGVICALRHIHMSPADALGFGLRDKDVVRVRIDGERSLIYGDVLVRVHPDFRLEMHIDTDEANAAEVVADSYAVLDSIQARVS